MNITKTEALMHTFGHYLFTIMCASLVVKNSDSFSWAMLFVAIWAINKASNSVFPNKKDLNGSKRFTLLLYSTIFMGVLSQQPVIDWIDNTTESIRTTVQISALINLAVIFISYWRYFTQAKHVEIPEPAPKRKDD